MSRYAWMMSTGRGIATGCCALALLAGSAGAISSAWNVDANGSWTNGANWNNGAPTNAGDSAYFTNAITQGRTVTIDGPVKVGAVYIGQSGVTSNFTINLGSNGTLTFDSGSGADAVLQLNYLGARPLVGANIVLNSDLDIISRTSASIYFEINSVFTGNHNIYMNPGVATGGTPYMGGNNVAWVGNFTLCNGQLLYKGGNDSFFGCASNGMRLITFSNNASLRNNGTLATLGTNKQIVVGTGGGGFILHGKNTTLPYAGQLVGTNIFFLSTDAGNNAANIFTLGSNNDAYATSLSVYDNTTLKFGASGSLTSAPLICLFATGACLDVSSKTAGYSIPPGQVLAGGGIVTGVVNVANAAAKIHPGTNVLAGSVSAPGVLTINGGLSFANGGVYAWDLNQLKDSAYAPGTTTYAQINVTNGTVNLSGGTLAINFIGVVSTNTPSSTNIFWKSGHTWTILTAAASPVGTLSVSNGVYPNWMFKTQVSGNTLQLVYSQRTPTTALLFR